MVLQIGKLQEKRKFMKNFTKEIGLITFMIDDPNYRRNRSTGSILSQSLVQIKSEIRQSISKKMENYFGDIVCHAGDNPQMNREMIELVSRFKF